jgi:hypothetical protein
MMETMCDLSRHDETFAGGDHATLGRIIAWIIFSIKYPYLDYD